MFSFRLTDSPSRAVSTIPRLSTSQNLFSMPTISSLSLASFDDVSSDMAKSETTIVSLREVLVGPERSHPNLLLTGTRISTN